MFVLVAAFLMLSPEVATARPVAASLVTLIQSAENDEIDTVLVRAATDATPAELAKAIPWLRSPKESERAAARVVLAYGGGERALTALQREYNRTRDTQAKALLCFALAARGSPEDRAFLIQSLRGEHFGDEWSPIVSAALALGVLRAREATVALRATVAKEESSIASHAAEEALRWMTKGPWRVNSSAPSESEADRVIAAAFVNGIPRTHESAQFFDAQRGGTWTLAGRVWKFQRGEHAEGVPTITLEPHINRQNTRAVLSVGLTFGPLNGSGYDYVFRKENGVWKVVGVLFTWIS